MATLKELRDMYVGKVIKFNAEVDKHELEFDAEMLATVIDITDDDHECCKFWFDFSDFMEHNRKYMKPSFYDKDRVACLTWEESIFWPKNFKHSYFFDYDVEKYPLPFDIVEKEADTKTLVIKMSERNEAYGPSFYSPVTEKDFFIFNHLIGNDYCYERDLPKLEELAKWHGFKVEIIKGA